MGRGKGGQRGQGSKAKQVTTVPMISIDYKTQKMELQVEEVQFKDRNDAYKE